MSTAPRTALPTVTVLDPGRDPVDGLVDALHPGLLAGWTDDQPFEPPPTRRAARAQVLTPWSGNRTRLLVAYEADAPVGVVLVGLPHHDNPHVVTADVHVAPASRRRGVGTALWSALVEVVREERRRTLLVEARLGTPLEAFLAVGGASPQLTELVRQQPVAALDLDRVRALREEAAGHATGYRLEGWAGPTPPELRAAFGQAQAALNDAPLGGLDYQDEVWDAGRIALRDEAVVAAGQRLHAVLAFAPDGTVAGSTDIVVDEDGRTAAQWGTAVAAPHRGHRLGMLLKATMVERLRALEPALQTVTTWNADSNRHMIAVNEALGYRVVDAVREWQLQVG